jgi:hypothetical protein
MNKSSSTFIARLSLGIGLFLTSLASPARAQVTFAETNFTFEAEDFNFTAPYPGGGAGQFIDNPAPCYTIGGGNPACYFDRVGTEGVDKHEINNLVTVSVPTTNEVYRFGDVADLVRDEFVDTFLTSDSLSRTQYTASGYPDYEVRNVAVGEWLNYTRTIAAGNYRVYLRAASSAAIAARLDKVSNATVTNQTLTGLGSLRTTNAPTGYVFVPLTDDTGTNEVVVSFSGGAETLRATALSQGATNNFYMLVATADAANLPPTVTITTPAAGATLTEGVTTNITVTAADSESTVTNVLFYAGLQGGALTLVGQTNQAPYTVAWTPPTLGSIRTYTLKVVAVDSAGLHGASEIAVVVRDPAIQVVSTAAGNGADAEMREQANSGVNYGGNFRTVSSRTAAGNNEIIALRFDLTGQTFARLTDVKLNLVSSRDDTSTRQLALYGVTPGTVAVEGTFTTETWSETNLTTFGSMPGLLAMDGDYLTQNLKTNALTLLGTISGSATKGEIKTFGNQALSDFIQTNNGNSQVTFLIANAPGYVSTGTARFSTKEATSLEDGTPVGNEGDFAPILQFKVLSNALPFVTITNPATGADLDEGVAITIGATASDADGTVANVQFYAGTTEPLTLLGTDATAPYAQTWTPPSLGSLNSYTLRVVATDNVGQSKTNSISVSVSPPALVTVSTAIGAGADVRVSESATTPGSVGNTSQLDTRANPSAPTPSVNDIVGLRFDLTGYTLSNLQNISLNFINHRTNSARTIDIYGVAQGTSGGTGTFTTETWDDATITSFGDLPGLQVSDNSFATLSLNTPSLTLLVNDFVITKLNEGTVETTTSAALNSFVQTYGGSSKITFIVTQGGAGSTGQFRFGSSEATSLTTAGLFTGPAGTFAPFLSFNVGAPTPPTLNYAVTGGGAGINFSWTGSFKLQAQTNNLSTGLSGAWSDYPGGGTSPVAVPVDPAQGTVFFRLAKP